MEKYRQKTALATFSDHVLRGLLAAGAGIGWFVYLWGLSLPALTAGVAMGGLIWLCARLLGKKKVKKKEAALRRVLGGELALDKLLLLPPRHAAFQAALWLNPKAPIEMHVGESLRSTHLSLTDSSSKACQFLLRRRPAWCPGTEMSHGL